MTNHVVLRWQNTNPDGIIATRRDILKFWWKLVNEGFDSKSEFKGKLIVPAYEDILFNAALDALRERFSPELTIETV